MFEKSDEMVELLLRDDAWAESLVDLTELKPDLTYQQAYQLQFEQMRRRVAAGERIVGYKAAGTSRSASAILPDLPTPAIGTLLSANLAHTGATYQLRPGDTYIEAEMAIVFGSPVFGPTVNQLDIARAATAFCPAMEIAPWSPAVVARKRSHHHMIASNKTEGLIVLGAPQPVSRVRDVRLEGAILEVDGEVTGSGTGVEAMGSPLEVAAAIARHLARHDLGLEPGMIVMTGSVAAPFVLPKGARSARVSFTSLGSVGAQFR